MHLHQKKYNKVIIIYKMSIDLFDYIIFKCSYIIIIKILYRVVWYIRNKGAYMLAAGL